MKAKTERDRGISEYKTWRMYDSHPRGHPLIFGFLTRLPSEPYSALVQTSFEPSSIPALFPGDQLILANLSSSICEGDFPENPRSRSDEQRDRRNVSLGLHWRE
ncbi:hypothetical protein L6164_033663 [Bauhinia variegata]|uniref:Uncharacterized protein n=1 Tax=Bauhinia variegata TaxID=167791 RepID=A0ACB9KSI9_BAUVA|nr:hypothetical protein L6164_033663 [Bauhinia variegata]